MVNIRLVASLAAALALILMPFFAGTFTVTLMNYIGVYAVAVLGLVILTGIGGVTSFGQASFVGISAYASAWLTATQGFSPWLGLLVACVITGGSAFVIGGVTLRLKGHFLPLSTIAWGIAIFYLFGNLEALGRFGGLSGVPPIALGPVSFASNGAMYYLIWITLGLCMLLCSNLLRAREGRAIRSLRGGKQMSESLGINTFRIRLVTFVVAALLAAISGWLYAHMSRFVSPAPFDVRASIEYLFMAIAGGQGYIVGAVVGAAAITLAKNYLQDILPAFTQHSEQMEVVVFSVLFIVLLHHARGGIVSLVRRWLPRRKPAPPAAASDMERREMPKAGTPLLEVEGLTKRFGGLVAVNNMGFSIRAGEILALIGPNGAGKSTMFNLIAGALHADEGKITLFGEDISKAPSRRIAALGLARTFQHVKLRPNMSLIDNVVLGTYQRTKAGFVSGALALDRNEERIAYHEAYRQLKRVGLGDNPHELAGNLSLGAQRILEVARALAADPALLILDEPAAGLRRMEKQALAELLRALRAEGVTILLVEHDMEFVMNLVDRIVVMVFGSKLTEGAPAAVRADSQVQEAYLGGVA
ncbi:branched-chain amino acid ABC transporter ATP-binding protein/permease [Mesorhizobium sp. L-8-3]|uniref:branched-chain amino acid ABC transporter ATP-binding protein/permease n=1 Tax=Mesorhizobium sp. L-8-3 TaxID=2744522 RepID=UPI0019255BAD|nr:branched-chain amino acid ABC transporter ATP-binding protein/permease [Mesorhizobium sp. L-8-3]BCH22694.1 metal-dependent hydrolase [Mesorhizobium sp. L-8-3]